LRVPEKRALRIILGSEREEVRSNGNMEKNA
jgi:hypothetical protein